LIRYQLQRFAGEKTERATPKRRNEARKEGNIPKSPDLTSAVTLVTVLVALRLLGPGIWRSWTQTMTDGFNHITADPLTPNKLIALFDGYLWLSVRMMAPLLGVALLIGLMTAVAQVGPTFLPNLLLPDFKRINVISGFMRLWNLKSVVELFKSIVKLAVVGGLAYIAAQGIMKKLPALMTTDVSTMVPIMGQVVFQLALEISAAFLVLAFTDFLFKRYDFEKSIRMSKDEIKQENKNAEGDPRIKSNIRQRGRALAFRRMMQEVPKADVVVTNPTHFAIALKYDSNKMSAPIVVAKGADEVAWRIRQVARDSEVPLVENKPLAQTLYKSVEIGAGVPPELFQAVAEILAYVYRLKNDRA
jgi:flagellar biosynthesis protein FlhB